MLHIYIGGAGHGQAALCEKETGLTPVRCTPAEALTAPAVADFHLLVRDVIAAGENVDGYTRLFLTAHRDLGCDCALTSDEIGGGVVPLDPDERRWREQTGRALGVLAAAEDISLTRVWYGIGEKLK